MAEETRNRISGRLDEVSFTAAERRAIDVRLAGMDADALSAILSFSGRLNAEQLEALFHPHEVSGPLLILAGAGSGKTTVLTRRIAFLLASGVPEESVFTVTFTRKAANEMAERLAALLAREMPSRFFDTGRLWISTFHSACGRLLRESVGGLPNIVRLGYRHQKFGVVTGKEQMRLVHRAVESVRGAAHLFTPKRALEEISDAKQKLLDPHKFSEAGIDQDPEQRLVRIYVAYQKSLVARNALDFDDMILLAVHLLETAPEVRAHYQRRFSHLLIDEYQDTNMAQYRLASLLVGDSRELFVVGDDDQSIYAFRGADIRNILEFRKDFPNAKIIKLETNYRSSIEIITTANNVFDKADKSLEKKLRVGRQTEGKPFSGGAILHYQAVDQRDEAEFVAEEIQIQRGRGVALQNFAVLYRTNIQAEPFCDVFEAHGIPYSVVGGRIVDEEIIQDVIAALRLIDFEMRLHQGKLDPGLVLRAHDLFLRLLLVPHTRFRLDTKTFQLADHWYADAPAGKRGRRCSNCAALLGGAPLEKCPQCAILLAEQPPMTTISSYEALLHYPDLKPEYRLRFVREGTWEHIHGLLQMVSGLAQVAHQYEMGELVEILLAEWGLSSRLRVSEEEGKQARWEKLEALVELATDFDRNFSRKLETQALGKLRSFLRYLVESGDEEDRINLLTLHSAKGLEWPTVFYVGMEEGLSPHTPRGKPGKPLLPAQAREQLEEEARLFYVGITRARDQLYLVNAKKRRHYGHTKKNPPSPFLEKIPPELLLAKDRSRPRQSGIRAGLERAAALLEERSHRRRLLESRRTEQAEKIEQSVALSIEARPLAKEGGTPALIVANPDLYGMVGSAAVLRAMPWAGIEFAHPNQLTGTLDRAASQSTRYRQLVIVGLPAPSDDTQRLTAVMELLQGHGCAIRWYDHHPWNPDVQREIERKTEDLLVRPDARSVVQILARRLLPEDDYAHRLDRLVANRLGPAEEQWGLDWLCLLEELAPHRRLSARIGPIRRLSQNRAPGPKERVLIRRNITRHALTDEMGNLAHREEFTDSGRKLLIIDLRRLHKEVASNGQTHYVLLYRLPNPVPLSRQACRTHEADAALLVHAPERFSVHRYRHQSGLDLRHLLNLQAVNGFPLAVQGHEYAVGMRMQLPLMTRWRAHLKLGYPKPVEDLIAEMKRLL